MPRFLTRRKLMFHSADFRQRLMLLFFFGMFIGIPLTHTYAGALNRIEQTITHSSKPVLLFIFASWCPHCREAFPDMVDLSSEEQNKFEPIFISVDNDPDALEEYLQSVPELPRSGIETATDETSHGALMELLAEHGINYSGSVPYTCVFIHGRLVANFSGAISKEGFRRLIQKSYDAMNAQGAES